MLAFCGLLAGGCGEQSHPEARSPLSPEEYGRLPGLSGSPDPGLRDELARIVEQGGTPQLLGKVAIDEQENAAAGFVGLFADRKISSILEESAGICPPRRFDFHALRLQKAIDFRKKYDSQRLQIRRALQRPKCSFGIQFERGVFADSSFIDVVRICGRLEAFRAAEALAEDDPHAAVESLGAMLRMARCLGAEKHVFTRLEAAFLRTEALDVLQAIARDDQLQRKHFERLLAMVRAELAAWPPDADAWIGDRASGLYAYEMVRDGQLLGLLTAEEMGLFAREGSLDKLAEAARLSVDRDELYYLKTMQKIIDSCSRPYYARKELFDAIDNDLQEQRDSSEFPLVAGRLLLPDVWKAQRMQARDRANWEAWAVALAAATGAEPLPFDTCPLTGSAYQVHKVDHELFVTGFGTGEEGDFPEIRVPLPQDDTSDGAGGERPG